MIKQRDKSQPHSKSFADFPISKNLQLASRVSLASGDGSYVPIKEIVNSTTNKNFVYGDGDDF